MDPRAVRIYDLLKDEEYTPFSGRHISNSQFHCKIAPKRDDIFGIWYTLPPDFNWERYTHVKVTVFVDDQYVRTAYLERDPSSRTVSNQSLRIEKGLKLDEVTGLNVDFFCKVGEVRNAAPSCGTIMVRSEVGFKVGRKVKKQRNSLCKETNSFKHADLEEIGPPKIGRMRFIRATEPRFNLQQWHFRYVEDDEADNAADFAAGATFHGLGKRSRAYEADSGVYDAKRPKAGGLQAEFSHGNEEPSVQTKPVELFPEKLYGANPVELFPEKLYGAMPFYGKFT